MPIPAEWLACLHTHRRPISFGLVGLILVLGIWWLDAALSDSQFSEAFVSDAVEPPTSPPVVETEQQIAELREQFGDLREQQMERTAAADPRQILREEIDTVLAQWISSWARQDVATYLSFYSEHFDTPFGISFQEWAGSRIRRIQSPRWIRVQLESVDYVQLEENYAALGVTQLYATPGYADRTRKHVDLVREEQGWKILREDSVETVRLDELPQ